MRRFPSETSVALGAQERRGAVRPRPRPVAVRETMARRHCWRCELSHLDSEARRDTYLAANIHYQSQT